jgi:hypothetical protein
LYEAKAAGKNRVCTNPDEDAVPKNPSARSDRAEPA